ncbi:MAG: B12-binding domain-containing radical SAM protein [candidate division WOR-3 bacterium]|nr:MAG: B12-binding domain-containing radical SAM protein [candidate division WOR-3 bacterium]
MKLLLISPRSSEKKSPVGFKIPQLALHILAALTPPDVDTTVLDEQISDIDFSKDYDLIGISIMTATAKRGYNIAQKFKEKESTVIFGGIHASVMPEEAIKYGDSVCIGEAEGIWSDIIDDFKNNSLKKFYKPVPFNLLNAPLPRRHIGVDRSILGYKWPGIYTTRGCPYRCEFCSVSDVYGSKIRHLPIPLVVKDIENADSKIFLMLDDNVAANPRYAKNLFQALAPLGIEWGGQSTITIAKDKELLNLCQQSGCRGLFIGVESVSTASMSRMQKTFKSIRENEDAIKKIQDAGILFHPSFVFGFDDDTTAIFDDTLEFLYKNKITTATFNILTPYPGTKLYHRLKQEERLISEDWNRYNHSSVVFRPRNMTGTELAEGYFNLKKEFYSLTNICRRVTRLTEISHPGLVQFFYSTFNNIAGKQTMLESYNAMNMVS